MMSLSIAAIERVVSVFTEELVIIGPADECIVSVAAMDDVAVGAADDRIVARAADDFFDIAVDVVVFACLAVVGCVVD